MVVLKSDGFHESIQFSELIISKLRTIYKPLQSCTIPVAMIMKSARSLAYVKTSCTRVAHFTSQQFTKVNTPAKYKNDRL